MADRSILSLTMNDLIQAGKSIFKGFDPKNMSYLDPTGRWKKNPETLRDCISNELLYHLWKLGEEKRTCFIKEALSVFLGNGKRHMTKKIALALFKISESDPNDPTENERDNSIIQWYSLSAYSKKTYPFLVTFEVLGWVVAYEAFRLNSSIRVPEWDLKGKAQQKQDIQHLQAMTRLVIELSERKEDKQFLSDVIGHMNAAFPEFLTDLPPVIAEEYRLTQTIHHLLEKATDETKRDEILPLIIEKILPPMGIANQTSPALLRPCLRLLMDSTIEIESGIPYNASVILSILQDPRSTEILLEAIEKFPANLVKIRENIIYTLGKLREKKAVKSITKILEEADEFIPCSSLGRKNPSLLLEQKEEVFLALGKIGLESLQSLPILIKYAEHPSSKLQSYLAWTLGEIGKLQKESFGGVSADIIITLLKLLKTRNKIVFEESVNALKKIDMPEFIHSLYLYNVGAVNILGLKPSQKGLYELSETVHYLVREKGQAIIAVNGDSGTGKTYFCQSLLKGIGDIKSNEILYLMRDRKKDQKVFNRMLGLKWLKKYIDLVYYHDYPLSEEEDQPEEYLSQFLEQNSNKKLILLDGCRDKDYFQRVIDLLYFRGLLDVEVNFRATLSTRRFNLEERESALESIRTHLSFLEEPALEDTYMYREGNAILYDLDNSISCRLDKEEIQELFKKERIESWGELIRIGNFKRESHPLKTSSGMLSHERDSFTFKTYELKTARHETLFHLERKFRMGLNTNIFEEPHLIGTIETNDLKPKHIQFYAQDQIAGLGEEGIIFILTFLDNRILHTDVGKSTGITLLGRKIFSISNKNEMTVVDFERKEKIKFSKTDSPPLISTALGTDKIVTGHRDGSIRISDFKEGSVRVLEGHSQPVAALASDYYGRVYSASSDLLLKKWDLEKGEVMEITGFAGKITQIKLFPMRKILVVTERDLRGAKEENRLEDMIILDLEDLTFQSFPSPMQKKLSSVHVHFDGRIFGAYSFPNKKANTTLALISPNKDSWEYKHLDSHQKATKGCLIMGPKLMTCGTELDGSSTVRIWGTDAYVRTELNKLIALSDQI
jgi:HEAT repeat protein/WD40 repeat protein